MYSQNLFLQVYVSLSCFKVYVLIYMDRELPQIKNVVAVRPVGSLMCLFINAL